MFLVLSPMSSASESISPSASAPRISSAVLIRQSNSILESVGDGIYGTDLEGRVTVINPAASQMLGYKPEEILGQRLHDLIHHSHADGSLYPVDDCSINRTVINRDTIRVSNEVFWRKDGSSFPVEYVARPQIELDSSSGEEGKAIGVVVAFTDTTERRALDRMKDEFVSTVSPRASHAAHEPPRSAWTHSRRGSSAPSREASPDA